MKKPVWIILGIICIVLIVAIVVVMVRGGSNEKSTSNSVSSNDELTEAEKFTKKLEGLSSSEVDKNAEAQMSTPSKGDTIATMHVKNYGDIKIKFFEDVAPKACENFITHAKEGYYNGLTFHRVINEFVIQGGDPKGDGTGGESIWGEDFGEEFSEKVLPYKGALCMASRGTGTKSLGSQFFVVTSNYTESMESYLYKNLLNSYKKYGGDLYDLAIRYQYTTFGQVFEGMDVVNKISVSPTNPETDKPLEDVVISSIEISEY